MCARMSGPPGRRFHAGGLQGDSYNGVSARLTIKIKKMVTTCRSRFRQQLAMRAGVPVGNVHPLYVTPHPPSPTGASEGGKATAQTDVKFKVPMVISKIK
jgi:hypothetical protein